MKQFIVIDQLRLNEKGALVCKNPSRRHYQKAHFKQGDLDGVSCAYSIAITFNILNVLNAEDTSWNRNEHEKATTGWELIRFLNTPSLYSKRISSNDIIKKVKQDYSEFVTIDHTGKRAGIPLKVKECIDNNIPAILQISFDQYETQWIVVVGYAKDKEDKVSCLLTLDSRKDLRIGHFWNGVLNLDRCTRLKYGFHYVTDTEEWVGLDDAIIIKKK